MRFTLFILFVILMTVAFLYVTGDRREPATTTIEQEVQLNVG